MSPLTQNPDHHQNLISCWQSHILSKFHQNPCTTFWDILLTAEHTKAKT